MKKALSLLCVLFLFACGEVETRSPDQGGQGSGSDLGTSKVFLFATDFSSGQLYTAGLDEERVLENSGVTELGSEAVIRFFGERLYILHSGWSFFSSDNVEILDPSSDFRLVGQFSTGNGTNPHDMVVVDNRAYISLYNPEQDSENIDVVGHPADLIVMNLDTGVIENRFSFYDYLNDDDSRLGRADQMVLVGDRLYICIQDLAADFSHDVPGKIGIFNIMTNSIEGIIILQGRNPVDIVYSEETNKLFVALQAPFDRGIVNYDISLPYGGIEIIPLDNPTNTLLLADEQLGDGGYVERLALSANKVFAVVSQLDAEYISGIVQMDQANEEMGGVTVFVDRDSDVREIAVDQNDRIWISGRSITPDEGESSSPSIDILDSETGEQNGDSLILALPQTVSVTSITFGNIE